MILPAKVRYSPNIALWANITLAFARVEYYHTGWMGELFHMCQDEYAIGKATAQLDFCSHHDGCSFRISPALTTPKNSGIYDIIRHLHPQFSKISQTQHQDM